MTDAVLYDYWRSSASYRLRIAMNLAGISYQSISVDLLKGEHKTEAYLNRNPQGLVPMRYNNQGGTKLVLNGCKGLLHLASRQLKPC